MLVTFHIGGEIPRKPLRTDQELPCVGGVEHHEDGEPDEAVGSLSPMIAVGVPHSVVFAV